MYKYWKASQEFKKAQNIHLGWDLVGYAFTMVIALYFSNYVIGFVAIGVEIVLGVLLDISTGKRLLGGQYGK